MIALSPSVDVSVVVQCVLGIVVTVSEGVLLVSCGEDGLVVFVSSSPSLSESVVAGKVSGIVVTGSEVALSVLWAEEGSAKVVLS